MADPQEHAPRGPLIRRDPIHPMDPMRCSARTRSGKQCGSKPIRGGRVCRMHGGGAPQVKLAAMERLRALQDPAINRLSKLIDQEEFPTVAYAASRDVLDRTLGKAADQQQVTHSGSVTIVHELPE